MKNIKIERNPNFAVAYCRFSSDRQNDASIEAQQRAIQKYAAENGITIIEWYIDKAQSAKNDHRINFQRMKKESDVLNYGKILVHKMDRFSRNILMEITTKPLFLLAIINKGHHDKGQQISWSFLLQYFPL